MAAEYAMQHYGTAQWYRGMGGGEAEVGLCSRRHHLCERPNIMPGPLEGVVVVAVEDDSDALDLLKILLEHDGARVVRASDAPSALRALRRVRASVLVSDLSMPEHDGRWLVAEARRLGLLTGVRALVVTAVSMTPQEVREAGFDAYLSKPVDPTVLSNTVGNLARLAA